MICRSFVPLLAAGVLFAAGAVLVHHGVNGDDESMSTASLESSLAPGQLQPMRPQGIRQITDRSLSSAKPVAKRGRPFSRLMKWLKNLFNPRPPAPAPVPVPAPVIAPMLAPVPTPVLAPPTAPVSAPLPNPTQVPPSAPVPVDKPMPSPVSTPPSAPVQAPMAAPTHVSIPATTPAPLPAPARVQAPIPAPFTDPFPAVAPSPRYSPLAGPSPVLAPAPARPMSAPTRAPSSPVQPAAPAPSPAQTPIRLPMSTPSRAPIPDAVTPPSPVQIPVPIPTVVPIPSPLRAPSPVPIRGPTEIPVPVNPVNPVNPSTNPVNHCTYRTRPELLKLVLFNETVDVSGGPAIVVMQVTARGCNGISICKVGAYLDEYRSWPTENKEDVKIVKDSVGEFNMTFTFAPYIQKGNYTLYLSLEDQYGNRFEWYSYYSYPPPGQDFPKAIQVLNTREDTSPPDLLKFVAVPPATVDVSNGPATASFMVEFEDALFGVGSAHISVGEKKFHTVYRIVTYEYYSAQATHRVNPIAKRSAFEVNVTFPDYLKSGNYSLQLEVADAYSNSRLWNATELANRGFSSSIQVANRNADVTPPQLVNLTTSSPTIVNASNGYVWASFAMTFSDNETGAENICMTATYDTKRKIQNCMYTCWSDRQWCPHEVVSLPIYGLYTFRTYFVFERGNCSLSVYLGDFVDNKVHITSEELTARGFPGYFTVV